MGTHTRWLNLVAKNRTLALLHLCRDVAPIDGDLITLMVKLHGYHFAYTWLHKFASNYHRTQIEYRDRKSVV